MEPPENCQSCLRTVTEAALHYRRGDELVSNPALLQCDVCERFACSECLRIYDIFSGYDFPCHTCARELEKARLRGGGH